MGSAWRQRINDPALALGPCWEVRGQLHKKSLFSLLDKDLGDLTFCPNCDLNMPLGLKHSSLSLDLHFCNSRLEFDLIMVNAPSSTQSNRQPCYRNYQRPSKASGVSGAYPDDQSQSHTVKLQEGSKQCRMTLPRPPALRLRACWAVNHLQVIQKEERESYGGNGCAPMGEGQAGLRRMGGT